MLVKKKTKNLYSQGNYILFDQNAFIIDTIVYDKEKKALEVLIYPIKKECKDFYIDDFAPTFVKISKGNHLLKLSAEIVKPEYAWIIIDALKYGEENSPTGSIKYTLILAKEVGKYYLNKFLMKLFNKNFLEINLRKKSD